MMLKNESVKSPKTNNVPQKNRSTIKREREEDQVHAKLVKNTPAGLSFLAKKIPINMENSENKTGIRKAGATRLIIFTPPNTIKHNRMVTTIP